MIAVRRALRAIRSDDRGISLPELIVTIMIFGIVLTVVGSMFATMTKATTYANATDSNVRSASNGMNEMTRMFRSARTNPVINADDAPAFSYAGKEQATFVTAVNLDPATTDDTTPLQVTFAVDAKRNLVETQLTGVHPNASSTYWLFNSSSPVTKRTLTSPVGVAPSGGDPLFRYFDASGAELVPPATGSLTGDDLASVSSVAITLRQSNSKSTIDNSVTLVNTVALENLRDGDGS